MKKSALNWLKVAERDIKCAKLCLVGEEATGTILHLHAAIEKLLKAICDQNIGIPPKTHSLQKLALELCQLELEAK